MTMRALQFRYQTTITVALVAGVAAAFILQAFNTRQEADIAPGVEYGKTKDETITSVVTISVPGPTLAPIVVKKLRPVPELRKKAKTYQISKTVRVFDERCINPYTLPGYLYMPPKYRDSQYIPFYRNLYDAPDPDTAKYPWAGSKSPDLGEPNVESQFLKTAPYQWMPELREYKDQYQFKTEKSAGYDAKRFKELDNRISFVKNKRILITADSIDRYFVQFFCSELGTDWHESTTAHTTAYCHVPYLNLTIYHWHLAGTYNYHPKWWGYLLMRRLAFEDRFDRLFKQTLPNVIGMNGRSPDLIVFQTALWDQKAFSWRYEREPEPLSDELNEELRKQTRQLTWSEMRFYVSRMKKYINHMRTVFGDDVPMVFRTISPHKELNRRDLMILNADRAQRFLAREMGMEVMEWGKLTIAQTSSWFDRMHLKKGSLSWIYHNMLMSYLFRISGGTEFQGNITRMPNEYKGTPEMAWEECHETNQALALVNR